MINIIMGPPGSGKGTQCKVLLDKYQMKYISTGDIIRNSINNKTELGNISKRYINAGQLVPDELIINLIEDTFNIMDCKRENLLLDGYPRTVYQAQCLDKCLKKQEAEINLAINLDVKDAVIINRVVSRRICSNEQCAQIYSLLVKPPTHIKKCDKCGAPLVTREDDNEVIIKERLKVYHEQTQPVIEYYKKQGKLFMVSGEQKIEKITKEIQVKLNKASSYY